MNFKQIPQEQMKYIVVHCAATRPSMDIGAEEITRWHRERKFLTIGYHYVIRRNGTVETGRPLGSVGAHVEGHNSVSVGICLVGGVKEDGKTAENNFTKEQFKALETLLKQVKKAYPKAEIVGHHDLDKGKACPSFPAKAWAKERGL